MTSNTSRNLVRHSAYFNTDRWILPKDSEIVYRHDLPGYQQIEGAISVQANVHDGGECIVEIGVDEISFVKCDMTFRKTIRMHKIINCAIAAMKQTIQAKLPKINEITSFNKFIETNDCPNKFICHLQNEKRKTKRAREKSPVRKNLT